MRSADLHSLDDDTTPILVCGVLAGLAGAVVGMLPPALAALVQGQGITQPAKLVAGSLMGRQALDRSNAMPAVLLGTLLAIVAGAAAGALFTSLRRSEMRMRLLVAEGIGFGLVLFGVVWATMPYLNPVMYERQNLAALGIGYALFGAILSVQLPLRVGSIHPRDLREDRVRRSLGG